MSTTHGQPGLSSERRSTIRSTILSTRHTLEDELRRQLEKYGIYKDKKLPLEDLSHLSAEERHTRRTLDAAIERELESTEGDLERSISNYVREATKTYLNRYVALKTIEVRGLVEETITERPEYGNRSYMHHTVAEIAGELTNAPDDGFNSALELAYQEIGAEIRMIFEESEYTTINLDPQVQNGVLEQLETIDDDAWKHEETIGWVYQYFGEDEREEIDDRIGTENYKVQGTDIATKTQLFTPRYIVQWMVDNSLGRLWLEMQGEQTNIDDKEKCFYLAPLEDSLIDRETKDVRDIKVLDPACGSGHMLFYAFDVLYEMYLEEAKVPEARIPNEILKNNLYGIDIDPGVAQLAALSLYVKAKTKEPDVEVEQINVVSADAVLVNGNKKKSILEGLGEPDRSILEEVWESFENIREYGSLVRIDEKVDEILEKYQEETGNEFASGQTRLSEGGIAGQGSLDTTIEGNEWPSVKEKIKERIRDLTEEALEQNNPVEEMFVDEVEKSVRLLDLFLYDYDVVVSNPPYLGSAKMGNDLKKFVKNNYMGYRDLSTAFIERCGEFSGEDDYFTLVTPENYMFLKSFSDLRSNLLSNKQIIEGAHLSGHSFDMGDRPFTIPFIMRNSDPSNFESSRYYRMTHEQKKYDSHRSKIDGLKKITETNRKQEQHRDVYTVDQNSFREIGNSPILYWLGQEVLSKFVEGKSFGDMLFTQTGLKSGNNEEFLRRIWEVPKDKIGNRYKPFVRSENSIGYYDQTSYLIDWKEDGDYIKRYCSEHNHQYFFGDEERLGQECIGFQDMSKEFIAREIPEGYYCGNQLYPLYLDGKLDSHYILGWLNSTLVKYIMSGLNPTMHFKQGDVKRLPYIKPNNTKRNYISEIVENITSRIRSKAELQESALQFNPEEFINILKNDISSINLHEDLVDCDRLIVRGIIDECIFEEYEIPVKKQERIYEDISKNLADYPYITNVGDLNTSEHEFRGEVPRKELSDHDYEKLINEIEDFENKELREISEELEVSPYTVAKVRHEYDLYAEEDKQEAAGRLLSYYLGCAMGRWELDGLDPDDDGIIIFNGNSDDSVMRIIHECLKITFDADELDDKIQQIEALLDRNIEEWLRNRFFRYHHVDQYTRRGQCIPIYWQLESPDDAFSCYVYYHDIDENTLPKLRGQYLDPRINELGNELETLNSQTSGDNPDKELLNRKEKVQTDLDDIRNFRDTIDEMIDDGVTVNVEDGIWENIKKWDQYEVLETGLPKLKSSYSR